MGIIRLADMSFEVLPYKDLKRFLVQVFQKLGMSSRDAVYITNSMLRNECHGYECHGVRRFPEYVQRWRKGFAKADAQIRVFNDQGTTLSIDGQSGFGHLVFRDALKLAVRRARQFGLCAITVKRSEAVGRLHDYCDYAANKGFASLVFANDSGGCQEVVPFGGHEPKLSTNPIAIGVPKHGSANLILDMATSTIAMGRLSDQTEKGLCFPKEWLNDAGRLTSFGGYKGFGLSLMVEALSGVLSGAGHVTNAPEYDDQSALIILIGISRFLPLEIFKGNVDEMVDYVRHGQVKVPGERVSQIKSEIKISMPLFEKMKLISNEFGVSLN